MSNEIEKVDFFGTEYDINGSRLAQKANIDGAYESMTVGNAEQLISSVTVNDKVPYKFRTSGGSIDIGNREVDKLVGGTIAWNQLVQNGNFADTTEWAKWHCTLAVANNEGEITITDSNASIYQDGKQVKDHKIVLTFDGKVADATSITLLFKSSTVFTITSSSYEHKEAIIPISADGSHRVQLTVIGSAGQKAYARNLQIIDLTQMFGSAIADYIYSLETATAGAGVAWFKKLFPKDYYPYDTGQLMSVKTSAHQMVGFNAYNPTTGTARLVGGMQYQITGTYTALSLNGATITPDASGYFTPSANGTLTVTGGNSTDTCVHIVWDGERDGDYEAYKKWTYPLDSDLELRGIPKLDSANNLYYDGDTYEDDGTVNRKYASVDLGTLTWYALNGVFYATPPSGMTHFEGICGKYVRASKAYTDLTDHSEWSNESGAKNAIWIKDTNYADVASFKTAMNGVYLVYELATPTTEEADPYQNPQIVDDFGTEEYIDERTVAIPVGHDTEYMNNLKAKLEMAPDSPDGDGDYIVRQTNGENSYVPLMKELPSAPSEDGTYTLKCTVASGVATLGWEREE